MKGPWWLDAACKNDPAPECWFPGRCVEDRARAIRVCLGCPVRNECLAEELAVVRATGDVPRGIRAGLPEHKRLAMVS